MLRYLYGNLSSSTMNDLATKQAQINALATRADRYKLAISLFSAKSNDAFREVKQILGQMSPPGKACFYCERDRYRDIEHVRPKRHFPEYCFDWQNYVYACTICNQGFKSDKYAVFDEDNKVIEFDRSLPITDPVPIGLHVLIDPRSENPLDFLQLDLHTGRFIPIGDSVQKKRGEYTRDLFELNESSLATIRKAAFQNFVHYLTMLKAAKLENDLLASTNILAEIRKLNHPTVLVEMRRQSNHYQLLEDLFSYSPDDIGRAP